MEEWIRWEPVNDLSGKYYLDSWSWPEEGLLIGLSNEKKAKKIQILFAGTIGSFRYINESFCFKICGNLSEKYGDEFYKNWSFFKIENSEYLKLMSDSSHGWADRFHFKHFCIVGGDEIIDIVVNSDPEVTVKK